MNYYEHHIGDYDADTSHLSWAEDMAYTRLIRLYYRKEQPIPSDLAQACRLVRATSKEERKAVETVLQEFFELHEDGWHQHRCDAEVEAYQKRCEHNRRVGKKGGRPRKTETQTEPEKNPLGYFRETQTEPEKNPPQTPDPRPQIYQPTNQRASAPDPVPPKPPAPPPEEPQESGSDPMPMQVCWQPSQQFHAMAKLAGLPPQDGQQFADGLAEFIAFWLTKPEEERTQSQWDHALVKSLQGRKAHSAGRRKPPAKADVSASAGRDLLPAWRRDEIRRQFEATPNLVPADLLPQIGIDPATRRPFARPAQGVTIIENIPLEIAHEPASRLG